MEANNQPNILEIKSPYDLSCSQFLTLLRFMREKGLSSLRKALGRPEIEDLLGRKVNCNIPPQEEKCAESNLRFRAEVYRNAAGLDDNLDPNTLSL